jgi:hypothetical protein
MGDVAAVLDRLETSAVEAQEHLMREFGMCPPPTVHMIHKDLDPQYLGSIRARSFRAGTDAEAAVSDLGLLPSMLGVSHLVVVWDHVDLRLAMVQPPEGVSGLVVLVADRTRHTLRWHPFDAHPSQNERGRPTSTPAWAPVRHYPEARLPEPIAYLLELWRVDHRGDVAVLIKQLAAAGFSMSMTKRNVIRAT